MSSIAISNSPSELLLSSPTSSVTYLGQHSDPMDFEPPTPPERPSFRFSPYPKRPVFQPFYKHPFAILLQNRGQCTGPSPSEAMRVFLQGIAALPDDILRSAVIEKYALAERSRLQLLLATWDLEGTRRRVHTLERIQQHLEDSSSLTESEYKFWHEMYTDRGLPGLKEDELRYGDQLPIAAVEADRDAAEFKVMVEHTRRRGLNIDHEACDDEGRAPDKGVGLRHGAEACVT